MGNELWSHHVIYDTCGIKSMEMGNELWSQHGIYQPTVVLLGRRQNLGIEYWPEPDIFYQKLGIPGKKLIKIQKPNLSWFARTLQGERRRTFLTLKCKPFLQSNRQLMQRRKFLSSLFWY